MTDYQDLKYPTGHALAGHMEAANGSYCGEKLGTPMQGKDETASNADPYYVEHNVKRQGTIMQDHDDSNFPKAIAKVSYDMNGANGTVPATQETGFDAKVTLASAPAVTTYPSGKTSFGSWNTKADGTGKEYEAGADATIDVDTKLYAIYA